MKTRKKLLALILTLAMALSCVVSAGAASPTSPTSGVGAVDSTTEVEAMPDQQTQAKYASGSADGRARSEGPLPKDPIRLELPTVNANVLNMILDPHGLINKTNFARYATTSGGVLFDNDTALYFLSTVSGDDAYYNYGKTSQEMKITNKSNLDVGVDVTLLVNKGTSNFQFVAHEEDLEDEANANTASMYLALQTQDEEGNEDFHAVAALAAGEKVIKDPVISVVSGGALETYIDATYPVAAKYVEDQYPKVAFQWAKAAATDAEGHVQDVSNTDKEAFISSFIGSTPYSFTLTFKDDGGVRSVISGDAVTTISGDALQFGAGTEPTGYTVKADPAEIMDTTNDVAVTVTFSKGDVAIGYAYFLVKAGTLVDNSRQDGDKATFTFEAFSDGNAYQADAKAHFVGTIAKTEDAYVNGWNEDGGYIWAFVEDYIGDNATVTSGDALLASWGHENATVPDGYNSITFNLYGDINKPADDTVKTSPWDHQGHDITLDLIWDVFAVSEVGPVELNGTPPTLSVTTKANTSNKKLVLTWTSGSEDYLAYAPETTLTLNNAATSTFTMTAATTTTGGTLTISNNSTIFSALGNSSTVGTVVFKATGKPDYPATVTGMR